MEDHRLSKAYAAEQGRIYSAWQLGCTAGLTEEKARRFRPYARSDDTVLDFGCGGGDVLASMHCARKIGVEPNPFSAESARRAGIEIHSTLDTVPEATVDLAISNHALEHCLSPLEELRGIAKVLKQKGTLVIILPIDDWRVQRKFAAPDINRHLYTWTPRLLANLLDEAGFDVKSVRVLHHAWPKGARSLWALAPPAVFDAVARVFAVALRRRQLLAVAQRIR